ncbi:hypothetical protein [Bradyrhizobium sp.]|uniref:hypothetical protein n=1 Tax=Bradyrhizobium sp. TaxID=376 RepID=UPI0025BAF999|nr:hypothetical protein [Bradyrhizobium sp.]MBV8922284.1 hypothetical protein [Bradyrhizobium sp.]
MKSILVSTCVAGLALASCGAAEAKGCIKGAVVGGVAGHLAGHGKLGAAAGCAIGHHEANKAEASKSDQVNQQQNQK